MRLTSRKHSSLYNPAMLPLFSTQFSSLYKDFILAHTQLVIKLNLTHPLHQQLVSLIAFMACTVSIHGFQRGSAISDGTNTRPNIRVVTAKQAVRSVRVKMAYSQSAAVSSSESCSASLYQLLSVPADASARDLKSAYRRMALRYHPDVCPPEKKEECSQMFVKVRAAYETLSDPLHREDYDWRLQNNLDLSEGLGGSGMNNTAWEAQLAELIRRSNSERERTWGGRMRSRNQQRAASAC